MNKQKLKEQRRVKTSITWDAELHSDIIILAELDNRTLSNYVETQMAKIRDKAIADGVITKSN